MSTIHEHRIGEEAIRGYLLAQTEFKNAAKLAARIAWLEKLLIAKSGAISDEFADACAADLELHGKVDAQAKPPISRGDVFRLLVDMIKKQPDGCETTEHELDRLKRLSAAVQERVELYLA